MGGWVGGVDKLRIKLSQLSIKVEVEVEAELGNIIFLQATHTSHTFIKIPATIFPNGKAEKHMSVILSQKTITKYEDEAPYIF